jgi:hypothetical protein
MEELILAVHRQIYYYNQLRMHTTLRDTPVGFRGKYEEKQKQLIQKVRILLSQNPYEEDVLNTILA